MTADSGSSRSAQLCKTPLNNIHRALGARMVDFGGWDMPVQYSGIIEEHNCVRTKVGLFDVSHMGECEVSGPDALEAMEWIMANNMDFPVGKSHYTAMCNLKGGIVDDLIIYRKSHDCFYIVLNASNAKKDLAWIREHSKKFNVHITDLCDSTAQIAIQGPLSEKTLQKLTNTDLSKLKSFRFTNGFIDGVFCMIARTGYTGEDGFELYFEPRFAEQLWRSLLDAGKEFWILPCGLGARDSLRLESGMMLYGNDLDDSTSPLETTIAYTFDSTKEFLGKKEAIANNKRKMIGFEIIGKGIARHGDSITDNSGNTIGKVTSGVYSPTLKKAIGLAMLDSPMLAESESFKVLIRGTPVEAKKTDHRFYKMKR